MSAYTLNRRTFLRGAGGTILALPCLESIAAPASTPTRMVCIGTNFGFVPKLFFPTETGRDYSPSPLLKNLAVHRNDFTVFSQLDHGANARGGHGGVHAFLSGIHSNNAAALPEANISIDQKAAQSVGSKTRFTSMQFATDRSPGNHLSWSTSGVAIPPADRLSNIFAALFRQTDARQRQTSAHRIAARKSILDLVRVDAKRLHGTIGTRDKEKLDQYLTTVRSVEKQLTQSQAWLDKPKPRIDYTLPDAADSLELTDRMPLYYDLIQLALQTDSTRIITLAVNGLGANYGGLPISKGYHQLTHHGKVESYLRELSIIETFHMHQFSRFLDNLKSISEPNGKTLFDNTITLLGSGLGNASSHSNRDLPLLLAGGGFRHGQHLAFKKDKSRNSHTPATNLYLSMLQRFGLEIDQFNLSTGTLSGLEVGA